MKIVLIRHGATKGNLEKRYIGRTDEDLCGEGIKKLKEDTCAGIYPPAQAVFSSPMKRCLSTAECIYPVQTPQIVWDFTGRVISSWLNPKPCNKEAARD